MQRIPVPCVPGGFLLRDVFSEAECKQLLEASQSMGYAPDLPQHTSASVLSDAFVWLVDDALSASVFERVRPYLPSVLAGGELKGINTRWRFYRYTRGVVYRPHIDGAWPGSGIRHGK